MPTEPSTPPYPGDWRRSSFCVGENNCVEVARRPDGSAVLRNSRRPGDTITLRQADWHNLLAAIVSGLGLDERR